MSRQRARIDKALREYGMEAERIEWEPIGMNMEMAGPSGGWLVFLTTGEVAVGLNVDEVIEHIESIAITAPLAHLEAAEMESMLPNGPDLGMTQMECDMNCACNQNESARNETLQAQNAAMRAVVDAASFALTMWTNPGSDMTVYEDGILDGKISLSGEWWDALVESGIAPLSTAITNLEETP